MKLYRRDEQASKIFQPSRRSDDEHDRRAQISSSMIPPERCCQKSEQRKGFAISSIKLIGRAPCRPEVVPM